jgi:hypothetical protein
MKDYFIEHCLSCGKAIPIHEVDAFFCRSEPTNLDLFHIKVECSCGAWRHDDGRDGQGIPDSLKVDAIRRHYEWLKDRKELTGGELDRLIELAVYVKNAKKLGEPPASVDGVPPPTEP